MNDYDAHEAKLRDAVQVWSETPVALDALLTFVRARAAYRQLDEIRAYGDDEAALTLQYVDEELEAGRLALAALVEAP